MTCDKKTGDKMEDNFVGKEGLRAFTLTVEEVIYIVLLETADVETVLVYRTLTCDRGMQVQEHQLIYTAKSKTFAVGKMFKEHGSIQVVQHLVKRARQSPTNSCFGRGERSKKEYVLTNQVTGDKHRFGRVREVGSFLGYKPLSFVATYAKQSKTSDKLYYKNRNGVNYLMTVEVGVRQKESDD